MGARENGHARRKAMIEKRHDLSIVKPAKILDLGCSGIYSEPRVSVMGI